MIRYDKMEKSIARFAEDRTFTALFALFLLALMLRLPPVLGSGIISNDGILYIEMAKRIEAGRLKEISDFGFFNLYPFLIALFQRFFQDWEQAGRMVSVITGSLSVVPLFLLLRKMVSGKVGFIAALLFVVSPRFVEYGSDVLRESSFWFFSLAALWLAWEGLTGKRWPLFVLSALLAGLASFTRFEGVGIIIIVVLWIFWYLWKSPGGVKRSLIYSLVFLLSIPVLAAPLPLLLKNRIGTFDLGLIGSKIPVLISSDSKQILEVKAEILNKTPVQFRSFLEMAKTHRYMIYLSEVLYKLFKSLGIVAVVLFFFGIVGRRSVPLGRNEKAAVIWIGVVFVISFIYVAKTYYFGSRHGLFMGIPALIWAGIGFFELKDRIMDWMGTNKLKRVSAMTPVVLLAAIMIFILPQTLLSYRSDKAELRRAGVYLKSMGYGSTRYMADPTVYRAGFYADSETTLMPPGVGARDIIGLAEAKGIRFLLIDERTVDSYTPGFVASLEDLSLNKVDLPLFRQFKEYSIVIYRIGKDKD